MNTSTISTNGTAFSVHRVTGIAVALTRFGDFDSVKITIERDDAVGGGVEVVLYCESGGLDAFALANGGAA